MIIIYAQIKENFVTFNFDNEKERKKKKNMYYNNSKENLITVYFQLNEKKKKILLKIIKCQLKFDVSNSKKRYKYIVETSTFIIDYQIISSYKANNR